MVDFKLSTQKSIKTNKMKKIVHLLILLISVQQLSAQGFQINGDIKGIADNTVVSLMDGMSNKEAASSKALGGKFTLTGKAETPGIFVLSVTGQNQKVALFIGNDKLSITGDIQKPNELKYTGSASQDLYQVYMNTLTPKMEPYFKTLSLASTEKSATAKDSLNKVADKQATDLVAAYSTISKTNNQSPVTTFFLFQYANIFPKVKDNLGAYYDLLSGDAKKGPFATVIEKTLATAGLGNVGTVLPDFKQNDVNGKSVSLSSLRGKYVLIDFWASWCGPCRAENPNVVKAFNAYKDKNFTVLGVSLDQDKTKWLDAIKKDGLNWTHVSDLKYWNNEVAVQFGIQSIPANYLIDPKGVVIGKDLRGEDLTRILSANLK